jgi:undecaprenyl-diphosphatase
VPRDRPHVARLDNLPADDSYPSGHHRRVARRLLRSRAAAHVGVPEPPLAHRAWVVALLLPVFVACSRMYRGMHHPLDVGAGALIGIGAVLVLLFACRAAGVAAAARAPAAPGAPYRSRQPVPS